MEEKSKFKLSSDMVTGIIIGVFSISIIIGILFLVYRAGKNDGINTAKYSHQTVSFLNLIYKITQVMMGIIKLYSIIS